LRDGGVKLGACWKKEPDMLIERATMKYAESYARAVDTVARERKFLRVVEGFPIESTLECIRRIEAENLAQYYAIEDGEVAGWCDIIPQPYEGFRHLGILGMGLLPPFRGRGLGTRLLERAVEHARKENGVEKAVLEVFESNREAVRLYLKMGFEVEGRQVRARKLDGVYDNIILMGKFL